MAYAFGEETPSQLPVIIKHLKIFRWGSTPLEFEPNSFYRISKFLLVITTFSYIIALYDNMFSYLSGAPIGPFTDVLELVERLVNCVYLPLQCSWILRHRFEFDKTMKRLMALQRVLGTAEYKMFKSLKLFLISSALIAGTYVISLPIYMNFVHRGEMSSTFRRLNWSLVLTMTWSAFCRILALCFFTYLICCLKACFSSLSMMVFVSKTDVKRFVRIYSHLVDVSSEISSYFDPTASTTLLYCFLHLIKVSSIMMSTRKLEILTKVDLGLSLFLIGSCLAHIIQVCHSTNDEADKCSKTLVKYIVYSKHDPNHHDPYAVLHLCVKKTVGFRMCKSITINYNLIVKMIAAYLTYTIVLFQTDISPALPPIPGSTSTNTTYQQST